MNLTLELDETTGKSISWLSELTGRTPAHVAAVLLRDGLGVINGDHWHLFCYALKCCKTEEQRGLIVENFRAYCARNEMPFHAHVIEAELSWARGEIDREQVDLISEAGAVLTITTQMIAEEKGRPGDS